MRFIWKGDNPLNWLDKIIESASHLGNLPSATIWALMTIILALYIYDTKKKLEERDVTWQKIREKDAEADIIAAKAIDRMAQMLGQHTDEIRTLRIIIDERLPHRT